MKHSIVAAMPTKNEEWIIAQTLDALSKFCEKIVVQDDGSTDKTKDICKSFNKVDLKVRTPSNVLETGMSGRGKADLLGHARTHDPDYVLMLDADEIPSPNIIDFLNNIDSSINAFNVRMINLMLKDYQGKYHYRTDSFQTATGAKVIHDPFDKQGWRKTVLLKVEKDFKYFYEKNTAIGGVSKYHPLPGNIPSPVVDTEGFYIMHYGKLNEKYISGEKHKTYAKIEEQAGRDSYENRFSHHELCRTGYGPSGPEYKQCSEDWFWE